MSSADFWEMTQRELAIHAAGVVWREEREDWRIARIVAAIYDTNRNPKKRRKPYTAKDFMPKPKKTTKARSAEGQKAILDGLVRKTKGWANRTPPQRESTDSATG